MAANTGKTMHQKLPELVEWYLMDKNVQVRFVPYDLKRGQLAPEFKFEYWMDGRRITERCLCMCIMTELATKDYNFNLAKIIGALTALAWRNYVATQPYPEWFQKPEQLEHRRPVGRPRLSPKIVRIDEFVEAPVNKSEPAIETT